MMCACVCVAEVFRAGFRARVVWGECYPIKNWRFRDTKIEANPVGLSSVIIKRQKFVARPGTND